MDAEGAKLEAIWHLTKISDLEAHVGCLKSSKRGVEAVLKYLEICRKKVVSRWAVNDICLIGYTFEKNHCKVNKIHHLGMKQDSCIKIISIGKTLQNIVTENGLILWQIAQWNCIHVILKFTLWVVIREFTSFSYIIVFISKNSVITVFFWTFYLS